MDRTNYISRCDVMDLILIYAHCQRHRLSASSVLVVNFTNNAICMFRKHKQEGNNRGKYMHHRWKQNEKWTNSFRV